MGYAGAFSAILTIIYPPLMVWKLRYSKDFADRNSSYKAPVGNKGMIITFLFGILIVALELLNNL